MLLTPALCRLYARLRGLDEASVTRATSWGLRKLGLAAYADRWTVAVVPILCIEEDIRAGNEPLRSIHSARRRPLLLLVESTIKTLC